MMISGTPITKEYLTGFGRELAHSVDDVSLRALDIDQNLQIKHDSKSYDQA